MSVFWDAAPCSLVQRDLRFRGAYCLCRHLKRRSISKSQQGSRSQKTDIFILAIERISGLIVRQVFLYILE
jgi:hypothetical protein